MSTLRPIAIAGVIVAALALSFTPAFAQSPSEAALLEMNQRLFESLLLEQDAAFLRSISDDSFFVVAPGGVVETRQQLIDDLPSFATIDSIAVQDARVVLAEETAVVVNRLLIHGEIQGPIGEIGPITVLTVFNRAFDGEWRAVARAYSTCDPQAVAMGLC